MESRKPAVPPMFCEVLPETLPETERKPLPFETPLTPWDHQLEAFWFAHGRPATLFHMGMGTGKTRVAIDLIRAWRCRFVLVACPRSVMPAWAKQARLNWPDGVEVVILDAGSVKARLAAAREAQRRSQRCPVILVINYEALWREPFGAWALRAGFDLVVADECHRIKSPGSRVSVYFKALGARVPRRLGLSGTPLAQGPLDAYAQFRFLDPSIFGTSYLLFCRRYAVMGGYENREVVGYVNMGDFASRLARITYTCSRDVLNLLPPVHIERTFRLEGEALRVYRDLKKDFVAEVAAGIVTAANALPRLLRLQQITSGFLPVGDAIERLHSGKEELLGELLGDLDADEPVVVFCRFREDLAAVHRAAERAGRTSRELSGSRDELAAWQGGEATVLAVQVQAGSEGVDFTRAAYAVFWSLSFSLAQYKQALARTHRPGQTRACTFVHLICEGSVDRRVYKALHDNQEVIDAILAGDVDAEEAA